MRKHEATWHAVTIALVLLFSLSACSHRLFETQEEKEVRKVAYDWGYEALHDGAPWRYISDETLLDMANAFCEALEETASKKHIRITNDEKRKIRENYIYRLNNGINDPKSEQNITCREAMKADLIAQYHKINRHSKIALSKQAVLEEAMKQLVNEKIIIEPSRKRAYLGDKNKGIAFVKEGDVWKMSMDVSIVKEGMLKIFNTMNREQIEKIIEDLVQY